MADTEISSEIIAAYSNTDYRVGTGPDSFVLRINVQSDAIMRLYETTGQCCALFITAYNPFGRMQSTADNEVAHSRLGECLRTSGSYVVDGLGSDPAGVWQEASFFALGVNENVARQFGGQFKQDAVVWVGSDAISKLLLLR